LTRDVMGIVKESQYKYELLHFGFVAQSMATLSSSSFVSTYLNSPRHFATNAAFLSASFYGCRLETGKDIN
jgi:hypothetical protein